MTTKKTPAKAFCPAKKTDGSPCGNPAGFQTDHFGMGLCMPHGGNKAVWQSTENPTLLEKVQQYQDDPEIFDSRRELAVLKAMIQELLEKASLDSSNITIVKHLREYLDSLSKSQERAFKILAAKQFYMTVAQVEMLVRKLGLIWQEETLKEIQIHPESEDGLQRVQNNTALRLATELDMPQLPEVED